MLLNFLMSASSTFRLPKQTINEQFALSLFVFVFSTLFHVRPILFPISSFFFVCC